VLLLVFRLAFVLVLWNVNGCLIVHFGVLVAFRLILSFMFVVIVGIVVVLVRDVNWCLAPE